MSADFLQLVVKRKEFTTLHITSYQVGGYWQLKLGDEDIPGAMMGCAINMNIKVVRVQSSDLINDVRVANWDEELISAAISPRASDSRGVRKIIEFLGLRGIKLECTLALRYSNSAYKSAKFKYADLEKLKVGDVLITYRPFRWETKDGRQVLTNGEVHLPAQPTEAEYIALGIEGDPGNTIWLWCLQKMADRDIDDWKAEWLRVFQERVNDPAFRWDTAPDLQRVLSNGQIALPEEYPAPPERRRLKIPAVGESQWSAVLKHLLGKAPKNWVADVVQLAYDYPLHWDSEDDNRLLTNGNHELDPNQRMETLPWGDALSFTDCPPGNWRAFLEGLSGKRPSQIQAYLSEFRARPIVAFHWKEEDDKEWLTNGFVSFPRQCPGITEWPAYKRLLRPIDERYWASFLKALEGKVLRGEDILPFSETHREAEEREERMTERQKEVRGVVEAGHMWDGKGAMEFIAVAGGTVIFTVERPEPLGGLYIIDNPGSGAIYFFASREEAVPLATGAVGRSDIRPNQLHLDHRPGWKDELKRIIENVPSSQLTIVTA